MRAPGPPTGDAAAEGSAGSAAPPSGGLCRPGLVSLATSTTPEGAFALPRSDLRHSRVARAVLESCAAIVDELQVEGRRYRCAFVTLTYGAGQEWGPRDITQAVDAMRQWCARRGYWFRYCWRFEFGDVNGRPHYHLVVFLPPRVRLPLFDKRGWWRRGMSNAKWARRPVGYLAAYCSRAAAALASWDVKGARWTGYGGVSTSLRRTVRWRLAPQWLREFRDSIGGGDEVRIARVGSRWRCGPWVLRSPWACVELPGAWLQFRWRGWSASDVVYAC